MVALLLVSLNGMSARPQGHNPALELVYRFYDDALVRLGRRAQLFVDWYGVHLDPWTIGWTGACRMLRRIAEADPVADHAGMEVGVSSGGPAGGAPR